MDNIFVTDCTIYNHFTPPVCLTSLVGLYKSWRTGPDQAADKANEKQRISASAGKECIAKRWTSVYSLPSPQINIMFFTQCSFPPIRPISYSLRPRPHGFSLPSKNGCNFIPGANKLID